MKARLALTAGGLLLFVTSNMLAQSQGNGWTRYPIALASSRAEILTVADITRDGWDDVLYTSWDNCQVRQASNNQNGSFSDSLIIGSTSQCVPELKQARNIEVAQILNGHAYPQILVSAYQGGHHMYALLSGQWTRFTIDNTNYGPAGIAAGHINNDGLQDVVTVTQGVGGVPGALKIRKNLDSGSFQTMKTVEVIDPSSVMVVDVDRDGSLDVVASDYQGALWWRNGGGFTFPDTGTRLGEQIGPSSKVYPADLNRDGVLDFVIVSQTTGIWRVDGTAPGTSVPLSTVNPLGGYHAHAAFFTHPDDGRMDIAVSTGSPSNGVFLFERNPDGSYSGQQVNDPGTPYTTGRSVAIADLLHNGKRQLVTSSYGLGTVDYWVKQ